jgi:tetratricopeptide (TPR) repeat protein
MILHVDSTSKPFIRLKGMASFNLDNFEVAEKCFNYLLEQGDSGKFILKHLGISELNIMKWHIARDHLLLAYQLDSNDFETCFFLGKAYLNSPTQARGLYYLDRADSLLQPDPRVLAAVYLERHSIYAALNQYEKAIECYKEAYALDPRVEYLFHIGSLYSYGLKDKRKALEYFELFISKLPPKPEEDSPRKEDRMTISMREAAERAIAQLKEELFFEGEDGD